MVAFSEKKLPARTKGECAFFLPRINKGTKIGTKGYLVIGDPRKPKEKLELISKGQARLPKDIRDYRIKHDDRPWWTFRFPRGKRIYLSWAHVAWAKKPHAK
jgi:hypothetical protein